MTRARPGPGARRGWALGLPVVLLLLAFALRVFRLGDQNLWWDEALAVWAVRQPLAAATLWTAGDVHPPLFFWTLWGWLRLLGQSPFAARYLMVVWSLLLCALGYALGRRLAGRPGGLLVLGLLALSRLLVWWSMELRMYGLAGLAVLAAVAAGLAWLDPAAAPRRRRWALAAYIAAATAALYTVYMTAAALALVNLAALAALLLPPLAQRLRPVPSSPGASSTALPWRALATWLAAQLLVAALFTPWLALALPRMKSWSVVGEPATPGFALQLWATLLATGVSVALDGAQAATALWWLAVLALPLAWLLARRRRRPPAADRVGPPVAGRRGPAAALLALFLVVPPLVVWAATQPRALFYSPHIEARYFLPFAAPVYVLAGWLLARVLRADRRLGLALAGLALLVMGLVLPGHYSERRLQDAFASMAIAIWSQAEPGDVVLLVSGNRYPLFLYDYDQPWDRDNGTDFRYLAPELAAPPGRPPVIPFPDKGSEPLGENDWQDRLEAILAEHPRVWLAEVDRHMQDPEGKVQAWLNAHGQRVLSEGYGANALHLYARDGQAPRVTQVDGRWPGMVVLPQRGRQPVVGLPARRLMPGDALYVTVFKQDNSRPWTVAAWLDASASVLDRLAGRWTNVAGTQTVAMTGTVRSRLTLRIDDRTPGGRHALKLHRLPLAAVELSGSPPLLGGRRLPGTPRVGPVMLVDGDWSGDSVAPGAQLVVDLTWSVPNRGDSDCLPDPLGEPRVFVHLVGSPRPGSGDPVWAGQDGLPSSGPWSEAALDNSCDRFDRHVLTLDPAAPPGSYTLEVGLYDPDTGERYPVSGPGADPANRRVILGTVEVKP